jgi:hypothetical protein
MNEDEMNAAIEREVDAKLEAELEARKAKMRCSTTTHGEKSAPAVLRNG